MIHVIVILVPLTVQKLDLQKVPLDENIDCSNVRGQVVVSLAGRDRGGCGPNVTDVSMLSDREEDVCSRLSPEIIPRGESRLPPGSVLSLSSDSEITSSILGVMG